MDRSCRKTKSDTVTVAINRNSLSRVFGTVINLCAFGGRIYGGPFRQLERGTCSVAIKIRNSPFDRKKCEVKKNLSCFFVRTKVPPRWYGFLFLVRTWGRRGWRHFLLLFGTLAASGAAVSYKGSRNGQIRSEPRFYEVDLAGQVKSLISMVCTIYLIFCQVESV